MSERLLTTEDVGSRLGVTATRVRAMIAAGRLPAQKFGPVYMILESNLHLVENRKTGRPPKPKAKATDGARSAGQKDGAIESRTATTRRLNKAFRQAVEEEMAGGKKCASPDGHVGVKPGKKRGGRK